MEWIVEAETLSDFVDHGRYTIASKPLIRCKDCKHYKLEVGDERYALGWCPFIKSHLVMNKGFCAWAERRTDEPDKQTD